MSFQFKPITNPYMLQKIQEEKRQSEERQKRYEEEERERKLRLEKEKTEWERRRRREEIHTDSISVFLKEEEGFCFDLSACISSRELYVLYCTWCHKERVVPESVRALSWRLKHSKECYPVRETILTRDGRRCRGFRGIRAVTQDTDKG